MVYIFRNIFDLKVGRLKFVNSRYLCKKNYRKCKKFIAFMYILIWIYNILEKPRIELYVQCIWKEIHVTITIMKSITKPFSTLRLKRTRIDYTSIFKYKYKSMGGYWAEGERFISTWEYKCILTSYKWKQRNFYFMARENLVNLCHYNYYIILS